MAAKSVVFLFTFILLSSGFISAVASPVPAAARIVDGIAVNMASMILKWLLPLSTPMTKAACLFGFKVSGVSSRSLIKFEGGYNIETFFEGTKLGIEPYSVRKTSIGELLILDSTNNILYKVSTPSSPYCGSRKELTTIRCGRVKVDSCLGEHIEESEFLL
ncbi:hypothetical protein Droror1_Dr00020890 [Drosera rotundifolia]